MALVVFLGLIALSLGWRTLIRTGLVLALAGALAVAGTNGVLLWRAFSPPGYITNTSGAQPLMQVK